MFANGRTSVSLDILPDSSCTQFCHHPKHRSKQQPALASLRSSLPQEVIRSLLFQDPPVFLGMRRKKKRARVKHQREDTEQVAPRFKTLSAGFGTLYWVKRTNPQKTWEKLAERAFLEGSNPTRRGCTAGCLDARSTALSLLHGGVDEHERLQRLSCQGLGIRTLLWAVLVGNPGSDKLRQYTCATAGWVFICT